MVHVMLPRIREHYALERLWVAAPVAAGVHAPLGRPAPAKRLRKAATGTRRPAARG
jgi:hypothetical protein